MSLFRENKQKRNSNKTEGPEKEEQSRASNKLIFVVQKHSASHLYYDFRLEINGVLKSWAIPKEPSNVIYEKRLAIETRDHLLEYTNFQEVITKGKYGSGTVEIWDKGTFDNVTKKGDKIVPIDQALRNGHAEF